MYDLLEGEIVPAFYERRTDGLPRKWVARMKASIALFCPEFNMHRMVRQYTNEYYLTAHNRYRDLSAESASHAVELASWRSRVEQAWSRLRVECVEDSGPEIDLGKYLEVSARVFLDSLTPDDVMVECAVGRVGADGDIENFSATAMQFCEPGPSGSYIFRCVIQPKARSGMYGYAVRVLPRHPHEVTRFLPGLILWAEERVAPLVLQAQRARKGG